MIRTHLIKTTEMKTSKLCPLAYFINYLNLSFMFRKLSRSIFWLWELCFQSLFEVLVEWLLTRQASKLKVPSLTCINIANIKLKREILPMRLIKILNWVVSWQLAIIFHIIVCFKKKYILEFQIAWCIAGKNCIKGPYNAIFGPHIFFIGTS